MTTSHRERQIRLASTLGYKELVKGYFDSMAIFYATAPSNEDSDSIPVKLRKVFEASELLANANDYLYAVVMTTQPVAYLMSSTTRHEAFVKVQNDVVELENLRQKLRGAIA